RADRLESAAIGDRYLEAICGRLAANALDADAIGPVVGQLDAREVRYHVGGDVRARVAHLVDQLLGHGVNRDDTACAGMLGDGQRTVRASFHDRIPDVRQVGNRSPVVEAVAPRTLRAALDDVAGDDSRGEPIPIVVGPAE